MISSSCAGVPPTTVCRSGRCSSVSPSRHQDTAFTNSTTCVQSAEQQTPVRKRRMAVFRESHLDALAQLPCLHGWQRLHALLLCQLLHDQSLEITCNAYCDSLCQLLPHTCSVCLLCTPIAASRQPCWPQLKSKLQCILKKKLKPMSDTCIL